MTGESAAETGGPLQKELSNTLGGHVGLPEMESDDEYSEVSRAAKQSHADICNNLANATMLMSCYWDVPESVQRHL